MTFNIYVISYNRADAATSHNLVEYCTYVVRDSQRSMYEKLGCPIFSAPDDEVNSLVKVQNWLIENAPEDVICILDDDIRHFLYIGETATKLTANDKCATTMELERLAQIVYDLDIGYSTTSAYTDIRRYTEPFKFCGLPASVKIINRRKCKSRYEPIHFLSDMDFQLQELLRNRIILVSHYFVDQHYVDVNAGGSNSVKTINMAEEAQQIMLNKWGKYFRHDGGGKAWGLNVKR